MKIEDFGISCVRTLAGSGDCPSTAARVCAVALPLVVLGALPIALLYGADLLPLGHVVVPLTLTGVLVGSVGVGIGVVALAKKLLFWKREALSKKEDETRKEVTFEEQRAFRELSERALFDLSQIKTREEVLLQEQKVFQDIHLLQEEERRKRVMLEEPLDFVLVEEQAVRSRQALCLLQQWQQWQRQWQESCTAYQSNRQRWNGAWRVHKAEQREQLKQISSAEEKQRVSIEQEWERGLQEIGRVGREIVGAWHEAQLMHHLERTPALRREVLGQELTRGVAEWEKRHHKEVERLSPYEKSTQLSLVEGKLVETVRDGSEFCRVERELRESIQKGWGEMVSGMLSLSFLDMEDKEAQRRRQIEEEARAAYELLKPQVVIQKSDVVATWTIVQQEVTRMGLFVKALHEALLDPPELKTVERALTEIYSACELQRYGEQDTKKYTFTIGGAFAQDLEAWLVDPSQPQDRAQRACLEKYQAGGRSVIEEQYMQSAASIATLRESSGLLG